MTAVCEHQPYANPRYPGVCVKCGRQMAPVRDKHREKSLLLQAADAAGRQHGVDPQGYMEGVTARMAMGEQRYQNESFAFSVERLRREMLEECRDIGGWGSILAQRLMDSTEFEDGTDDVWHVFEAIVHAVAADWHVRQVSRG